MAILRNGSPWCRWGGSFDGQSAATLYVDATGAVTEVATAVALPRTVACLRPRRGEALILLELNAPGAA